MCIRDRYWVEEQSDAAEHVAAAQVAAVRIPALHEVVPDTVYPVSHVGWHVDPDANELVQSPTPPFVGALDASHGLMQFAQSSSSELALLHG